MVRILPYHSAVALGLFRSSSTEIGKKPGLQNQVD